MLRIRCKGSDMYDKSLLPFQSAARTTKVNQAKQDCKSGPGIKVEVLSEDLSIQFAESDHKFLAWTGPILGKKVSAVNLSHIEDLAREKVLPIRYTRNLAHACFVSPSKCHLLAEACANQPALSQGG